ncbi:cadherin-like domain-containing protein [Desulfogranum japonicum]|uniref:cadherin-like domain-containing protein n=1 Tax=Desulfogranum japonicum TaxID=231447 RepID=UPI00041DA328|nr:cadherin-like domain-containing protein [Desulfogranum japonicum]
MSQNPRPYVLRHLPLALSFILFFLLLPVSLLAGPTINSDDLVLVARNTDLDDQFALVALADIPGNSIIFITDEGWDDSDFTFDGAEDCFKWTVHSNGISAGSIIRFTNESTTTLELEDSNHGTLTLVNGSSDMNVSAGDQLFLYQTADDTYTGTIQRLDGSGGVEAGMIYAFNGDNSSPSTYGWLDPGNVHTSAASQVPDNMTVLSTCDGSGNANVANANGMLTQCTLKDSVANEYDNYRYDGPTTAAIKSDWLIRLHTTANWLCDDIDTLSINSGTLVSDWTVSPDNLAPTISISDTNLTYTENDAATQIDPAATASDADGDADWNTGTLVVQITANNESADELSIPDNVVGTINTSGTSLLNSATAIGTLSASEGTVTNGTALTVTFNSNATNSLVEQTVRAVHYRNTSENPGTSNRTITFTVTDANTGTANDTRTVEVSGLDNDPPTIATNSTLSLAKNATATITTSYLDSSDVDDADTAVTFTVTTGPTHGQLENTDNSGVSITTFTQQNLNDGKIRYVHDGTATTSDSFVFTVADDGANDLTNQTFNLTITNTLPVASNFTASPGPYQNVVYTFSTSSFSYADDNADVLDHVRVTAVPGSGTLYVDANNNDTYDSGEELADNDQVSKANLDAGNLQYLTTGTTNTSFTFDVNDGTAYSTSTYTASLNITAEPTVTLSVNNSSIAEAGGSATVTATLSHTFGATVTTNLNFTGTATLTDDYTRSGTSIAISSGTTGTVSVTAVDDSIDDDAETIIVDITGVTNGAENGTQQVTVTITDDDVLPTATTNAASAVSSSGATLNGSINANNASTAVTFEYGTDTNYGNSVTADQSPVTGSSGTAVSKAITGLLPGQTYHFRVVGVSAVGNTNGNDQSFTTPATAPSATTNAASSLTASGARLNGNITANGASTTVTFEYGTTTGYGSTVTADQSPVTGNASTAVSKTITGLTYGQTYHYRVVGTNSQGTTNGTDQSFTITNIAPTVTTQAVTDIASNTATGNGTITDLGVPNPTAYGMCWNTSGTPTVSDNVSNQGATSTTGAFTSTMSVLTPDTTYYVRAYATNTTGTSYGGEVSFTTEDKFPWLIFYRSFILPSNDSK